MKIAGIQMDILWEDQSSNYAKVRRLASEAKEQGADLIVLPEMFSTGFSMDTSITAEAFDGATPSFLRSLARELDLNVVGGFVLVDRDERAKNVSLAVDRSGNDLALYAKVHLIAWLGEDRSHKAGDGPVLFSLNGLGATCFICYDLRFPELFRLVVDKCALIMVIASWPAGRQPHWDLLLPARAVENQCFVIGVNRVGTGGGHIFTGGSAIIDPLGRTMAHGGDQETILLADIDPSKVEKVRSTMPFLRDRKPHLFKGFSDS